LKLIPDHLFNLRADILDRKDASSGPVDDFGRKLLQPGDLLLGNSSLNS
jgi:hypothetical protein